MAQPTPGESGVRQSAEEARNIRKVVAASAAGTVFEWYDFFIYGSLASAIAANFFSSVNESTGFIFALLVFAAGFGGRPLGALAFGWLGDRLGRKRAFLITMVLMGTSTCAIGLLPTFAQVGVAAPIALIVLRILQGFSLGGEYGGAAIYVAEHARANNRGFLTSFIQTTGGLGLLAAMLVIFALRSVMDHAAFMDWGWRLPFILSVPLLGISVWFRLKLSESPVFKKLQAAEGLSHAPFKESFLKWANLKFVLLTLFGLTAAQGAIWYTIHFHTLFFLERILKVDTATVTMLLAAAVAIGAPLYIFFGWLSDHVGRKAVMFSGMALAVLTFFPGFRMLADYGNPALMAASAAAPVVVVADPADCSLQFDAIGKAETNTACDIARNVLASAGISYTSEIAPSGRQTVVRIGASEVTVRAAAGSSAERKAMRAATASEIRAALTAAGYPEAAAPESVAPWRILFVLVWYIACAAALYGPMAAALVELFPTRIRYTALSAPYHLGIGVFGGLMPASAFSIVAVTGDAFAGLWYPVIVGGVSTLIGLLFWPETRHRDIHAADLPIRSSGERLADT